ncbi:MAG: outer membrane beta-barrel protein [Candidatus Symbiothrix sp.]|nr:outer membrane beta-barrel protein [Candidatus Symbiothrix sp.]
MKTKILAFVLLFSPFLAVAQMDSTTHIRIQLRGGYADQTATTGAASISAAVSQGSSWNVGLTLGAALNRNWEVGVGVEYQRQKMETTSSLFLPFGDETWMAQGLTETKVSAPVFSLYSAYYLHLCNRLYLTPRLMVGYGNAKRENRDIIATMTSFPTEHYITLSSGSIMKSGVRETSSEYEYEYFGVQLSPELQYFFNDNIGVSLGLGGIQLAFVDWAWDSKQWIADFSPAYWKLGLVLAF